MYMCESQENLENDYKMDTDEILVHINNNLIENTMAIDKLGDIIILVGVAPVVFKSIKGLANYIGSKLGIYSISTSNFPR